MSAKRLALSLLAPMLLIAACSNNDNPIINGGIDTTVPSNNQGSPLVVTPGSQNLEVGKTIKLTAQFNQDGTIKTDLPTTWVSLDNQIASVDGSGNVTALKPGNVKIEAQTLGNKAQALITIVPAGTAATPGTQPSANPTASPSPCVAPAGAPPDFCTIATDTSNPALAKLRSIVILPENQTVQPALFKFSRLGETAKFIAEGRDSENQKIENLTFTWSSSNEGVATVNSTGVVTAVSTGTSNLIAQAGNVTSSIVQVVVQEGTIRAHIRFME